MLKCLLLDDELPGLAYLKMLCEQLEGVEVVKAFNDPMSFIKEAKHLHFDFCIIDIQMPQITGLQIAEMLRHKPIIFATAYTEFAAEAYDLDAVDYIRKPIQKERLDIAIRKIERKLGIELPLDQSITVNTHLGRSIIHCKDILYICTSVIDPRDKEMFLPGEKRVLIKNISFEKLQQLLPLDGFIRINKKQVLAKKIVRSYTSSEIISTLTDVHGNALHFNLSDAYRTDVLNHFPKIP
jgi:two-component system LytT family response regulator